MSRIMQHDTISEAGEKPLLKGMRGAASVRRIVRTRSKGNSKGGKSGWKSLLSVSSKRRTKQDTLDLLDEVLNVDLIKEVPLEPLEPLERKIRFDLSSNQAIEADPEGLTEQEIKYCWWNRLEHYQSVEALKQEIRAFFREQEDSLKDMVQLVSTCNESSSDDLDDLAAATAMIPLNARGMESELLPMLKSSRKRHSESVLDCVNKIPSHLQPDLKDRMLSARSIQYSRTFKILARVQGEADALAVLEA
jgi:hypothetical protein